MKNTLTKFSNKDVTYCAILPVGLAHSDYLWFKKIEFGYYMYRGTFMYIYQWIMDALVCNGLGIYLGMKTLNYLSMKRYHWRGMWNIPTYR